MATQSASTLGFQTLHHTKVEGTAEMAQSNPIAMQAWGPEFKLQIRVNVEREATPQKFPLTFTCGMLMGEHTHLWIKYI